MILLLIALALCYMAMLVWAGETFSAIPEIQVHSSATNTFSIIVPFRNEENNIPGLISSLSAIIYDAEKTEFLFIDDHSTDHSLILIQEKLSAFPYTYRILQLPEGMNGKKTAIEYAAGVSHGEWIITTDADCTHQPAWIRAFDSAIQSVNPMMICGPVVYQTNQEGITGTYQQIENAGLVSLGAVGIAKGKPFMANGANFCYLRSAFQEAEGYEGNREIASGDDEFLLKKFQRLYPGKIVFLKNRDAMVSTRVQPNLSAFLQQRIRWASKAKKQTDKSLFIAQIAVMLFYLLLLASLFAFGLLTGLIPVAIKIMADLLFFTRIRDFFRFRIPLADQIITSLMQFLFIPVTGILSFSGSYRWKSRTHR